MTADEARREIRRFIVAGNLSQRDYAKLAKVTPAYVTDVLLGRREPTDKILKPIGMVRKTVYKMTYEKA